MQVLSYTQEVQEEITDSEVSFNRKGVRRRRGGEAGVGGGGGEREGAEREKGVREEEKEQVGGGGEGGGRGKSVALALVLKRPIRRACFETCPSFAPLGTGSCEPFSTPVLHFFVPESSCSESSFVCSTLRGLPHPNHLQEHGRQFQACIFSRKPLSRSLVAKSQRALSCSNHSKDHSSPSPRKHFLTHSSLHRETSIVNCGASVIRLECHPFSSLSIRRVSCHTHLSRFQLPRPPC